MIKRKVNQLRTKEFFEWISYRFSQKDEDPDLRMIEYSLIRCMSEYRKAELSSIHFSEEANRKFIQALEKEETFFAHPTEPIPFWQTKVFRYSLALLSIAGITGFLAISKLEPKLSSASPTAASVKLDPDVLQELKEELQLIKHIRNSDDIDSLRVLEKYNLSNGITDRATRIHYTIELLSK